LRLEANLKRCAADAGVAAAADDGNKTAVVTGSMLGVHHG